MKEKIFELIKTNLKNPQLYIALFIALVIVLLLFPYIDANYFYYSRVEISNMERTYEDVAEYVENQSQGKCKVLSAKPEHTFEDPGFKVIVWNVKTDVDGAWWVVEGEHITINNPKVIEDYVNAMEESANKPVSHEASDIKFETDSNVLKELMLKGIEKWGKNEYYCFKYIRYDC